MDRIVKEAGLEGAGKTGVGVVSSVLRRALTMCLRWLSRHILDKESPIPLTQAGPQESMAPN